MHASSVLVLGASQPRGLSGASIRFWWQCRAAPSQGKNAFPKLPPARGFVSLPRMKAPNLVEAPVDFVIVTALEEERDALLAKVPDGQADR